MPLALLLIVFLPYLGYGLGVAACYAGASFLKWWIVGLAIMTWWSRGAIGMANQAIARGDMTPQQSVKIILSHWVFLIGLLAVSIWSLTT